AAVAADLAAVQEDGGMQVHRFEAQDPGEVLGPGGDREVLAVPADAAAVALVGEVAGVPGVRDGGGRPSVERHLALEAEPEALVQVVTAEVPRAVHEEAAGLAVLDDRPGRGDRDLVGGG